LHLGTKIIISGILLFSLFLFMWQPAVAATNLYAPEAYTETNGQAGPWYYSGGGMTLTAMQLVWDDRRYTLADVVCGDLPICSGAGGGDTSYTTSEHPWQLARRYSAVLALTGDYLTHSLNDKGVMIRNGTIWYDGKAADTLAMLPEGRLAVYPAGTISASELLENGVVNSWAFGPILVMNGKAYEPALRHPLRHMNVRSVVAMIEPGHFLFLATTDRFTNSEMQTLLLEYDVELAYQLDGGHSAALVLMGEQLNPKAVYDRWGASQRRMIDMLLLGQSSLVPERGDERRYSAVFSQ
jgi:hypothetical protein